MEIPEILKAHVLKNCGRMPETEKEVNDYLDLINHLKEYETSVALSRSIGRKAMKKYGIKTPEQVKSEGQKLFKQ